MQSLACTHTMSELMSFDGTLDAVRNVQSVEGYAAPHMMIPISIMRAIAVAPAGYDCSPTVPAIRFEWTKWENVAESAGEFAIPSATHVTWLHRKSLRFSEYLATREKSEVPIHAHFVRLVMCLCTHFHMEEILQIGCTRSQHTRRAFYANCALSLSFASNRRPRPQRTA